MSLIRLLFLAANPADTTRLALDEEVRAIQLRLRSSGADTRFEVRAEWALRPEEIQPALLRHRPHLVHLSTHGLPSGELRLVSSEGGSPGLVQPDALSALFRALAGDIHCVLINACYSAQAASQLSETIPCAIGMIGAISDSAAIAFAGSFYEALAFGKSVRGACELGRSQLHLARLYADSEAPRIFHREGCEPETLFVLPNTEKDDSDTRRKYVLGERIQQLYIVRENLRQHALPVTAIEQELASIKRLQRQGPQLHEGEVLAERYSLLEIVGQGGFAKVWQAFDVVAQRLVALKVLRGDLNSSSQVERFQRGARKMHELNHPHIMRVLSAPAEYEGFHFFAMEYAEGGDLAKAIQCGRLSQVRGLQAVLDAGKALQHAHAHGLIHRDVKPSNILLSKAGEGRLTDFDLVWAADTTGGTRTGAMGTFLYAAPELLEDASRVDCRADVYALGMTALFVLYGKSLPSQIMQDRATFVKRLDWPSPIKLVIGRAIDWHPAKRYCSVEVFIAKLQQALRQVGLTSDDLPIDRSRSKFFTSHTDLAANELPQCEVPSGTLALARQRSRLGALAEWFGAVLGGIGILSIVIWKLQAYLSTPLLSHTVASEYFAPSIWLTRGLTKTPHARLEGEPNSISPHVTGALAIASDSSVLPKEIGLRPEQGKSNKQHSINPSTSKEEAKRRRSKPQRRYSLLCTPSNRLVATIGEHIGQCQSALREAASDTVLILPIELSHEGLPVLNKYDPPPQGPASLVQCLRGLLQNVDRAEVAGLPRSGLVLHCVVTSK